MPAREVARGLVAGFLGMKLLTSLEGGADTPRALFDRALLLAGLTGSLGPLPSGLGREPGQEGGG